MDAAVIFQDILYSKLADSWIRRVNRGFLGLDLEVVVWDRELGVEEWQIRSEPYLHARMGDHVWERFQELSGDFSREELIEVLMWQ